MSWRAPLQHRQRAAVMVAVVSIHALLILSLLLLSTVRPDAKIELVDTAVFSILSPKNAAGKPPPPALPSKMASSHRVLAPPAVVQDPNAMTETAGGCAPLEKVTTALVADEAAVDAIVRAPPESRSIADAVVVWNAGWIDAAREPGSALFPARSVLEQSLTGLPPSCLSEPVVGPRLIPIALGDGSTMFVVIGSGTWTWSQLLDDESYPSPATARPEVATKIQDWLSSITPW